MQLSCGSKTHSFLFLTLNLLCTIIDITVVVADDLFSFANLAHSHEWHDIYKTCSRDERDTFREPRTELRPDDLRAPFESLGPVPIVTKDTIPSEEPGNRTLHIYSNPGVRNGYSVSYGFQKNKECLHGQDGECVVSPDFGRVRALVVNAERFKKGQNLNFIKDHFYIEETEKFVTILNGGSIFERKFYEAVFLGGYPKRKAPSRSSHTVDGKPFPLEIYMYFVDETVPSMTLTTIVVVLVEESRKDNPHIKPIINTVRKKLYDAERQYIESNRHLLRVERLYHNLRESLQHDIFKEDVLETEEIIFQKSLAPTTKQEGEYADYFESFERLQALSAELQFHDEDKDQIDVMLKEKEEEVFHQLDISNDGLPHAHDYFICAEQLFLAQVAFFYVTGFNFLTQQNATGSVNDVIRQVLAGPPYGGQRANVYDNCSMDPAITADGHFVETSRLAGKVGDLLKRVNDIRTRFADGDYSRVTLSNWKDKYEALYEIRELFKERDQLNEEIYNHFHEDAQYHLPEFREDFSLYKHGKRTAKDFFESVDRLFETHGKQEPLKNSSAQIQEKIDAIWNKYSFPDETVMRDIIRYLKYGEKDLNVQIIRSKVHDQIWANSLPLDEKRRGLVEMKNMQMSDTEIKATKLRNPTTVPVEQAFQISWLMPPHGGYYYYAGSSPLPPCFRAQNVIVFKKPITMSRDQITWLTKIPRNQDRKHDIPSTTPILRPLKYEVTLSGIGVKREEEVEVKVYDQPRNHIYLGNDGVHKNAIELLEQKKGRGASGGEARYDRGTYRGIFVGLLFGINAMFGIIYASNH